MDKTKLARIVPSVEVVNKFMEGMFLSALASLQRKIKIQEDKREAGKINARN